MVALEKDKFLTAALMSPPPGVVHGGFCCCCACGGGGGGGGGGAGCRAAFTSISPFSATALFRGIQTLVHLSAVRACFTAVAPSISAGGWAGRFAAGCRFVCPPLNWILVLFGGGAGSEVGATGGGGRGATADTGGRGDEDSATDGGGRGSEGGAADDGGAGSEGGVAGDCGWGIKGVTIGLRAR